MTLTPEQLEAGGKSLHDEHRTSNGRRRVLWENEMPEYRQFKRDQFARAYAAAIAALAPVPGAGYVCVPRDAVDEAIGAMDGAVAGLAALGTPTPTLKATANKLRAARDAAPNKEGQ